MPNFAELWENGGLFKLTYQLSVRNLWCWWDLRASAKIVAYYTLILYGPLSICTSLVKYEPLDMKGAETVIVVTKIFAFTNVAAAIVVMAMSVVFLILGFGEKRKFFIMELYCIIFAIHNLTNFFYNEMLTIAVFFAVCTSALGIFDFYFRFVTVKYLAFIFVNFNVFLIHAYYNIVIFSYRKRFTIPFEKKKSMLT